MKEVKKWFESELDVPKVRVIDLYSPKGLNEFRNAVSLSKGYVFTLVHPFFYDRNIADGSSNGYADYKSKLQEVLTKSYDLRTPILVFEEYLHCNSLSNSLGDNGARGSVFFIRTKLGEAQPYGFASKKQSWARVTELLQRTGTKRLLIGGCSLKGYPKPLDYEAEELETRDVPYVLGGCVGMAITRFLEAGFSTILHPCIYPSRIDGLVQCSLGTNFSPWYSAKYVYLQPIGSDASDIDQKMKLSA